MRRMNINAFKQCMQLGGGEDDGLSAIGTPTRRIDKGPGLKTLLAQPKATLLPNQRFESPSVSPKKNETISCIGIFTQHIFYNQGKRVDSAAHVLVPSG